MRIDDVQLDNVLGLRFNVWTSIVLFVLAAAFFAWSARRHPGREETVRTREPDDADDSGDSGDSGDSDDAQASGDSEDASEKSTVDPTA